MFKETIRPTEIQPFEEAHPGEEVYLLDVAEVRFGFLYVTPWASTLGWNGTFDFSRVEIEVFDELSTRISDGQDRLVPNESRARNATVVYLATSNESSVDCDLKEPEAFQRYKDELENFSQISFIRYDVQDTSATSPLVYSFTAENPPWVATHESELTIKLPKFQSWSARLLEWVTEHHSANTIIKDKIDLKDFSATLSKLSHQ
jgi:hypothetical protein